MLKHSLLLLLLLSTQLLAGKFELYGGLVFSGKEDILIIQTENPNILIENATIKTKEFTPPPYYGMRYTFDNGLEIEHNHMKIYIEADELPANVQQFEVTDGYNFFWINKIISDELFITRLGFGPVITHPDIKVYGETNYEEGWGAFPAIWQSNYRYSGWAGQVSVQKTFDIANNFYFSIESKFVIAQATIQISDGYAITPNRAIHINYGFGYNFN
jgi:hypothetical protein